MSRHSFDPKIACRVGLNAAVIFQNISFWVEKNQANRRNFRDGKYWTYNSIKAFSELFSYLSEKQIRTALEKLVEAELIVKGNYSKDRYDRTCWYALGDSICPSGQADPPDREHDANAFSDKSPAQKGKSSKSRSKPDEKPFLPESQVLLTEDKVAEEILGAYPVDRIRNENSSLMHIRQALTGGVDAKDLGAAVNAYAEKSAGFSRGYVSFSDNWFASKCWLEYLGDSTKVREASDTKKADVLNCFASWVKNSSALCSNITPSEVSDLLANNLVSQNEVEAAGLTVPTQPNRNVVR